MTEERKFAILFAATILAARKLVDMDPNKPNMAKGFFVDRAIEDAAFILEPSSALAAVPKVLARRYRGTIRCRRFAQYPSPSSVCGNEGRSEAPVASKRVI